MFQDFDPDPGSSSCPMDVYKITLSEGSFLLGPTSRSEEVDHSGPHQSEYPHLSNRLPTHQMGLLSPRTYQALLGTAKRLIWGVPEKVLHIYS